MRRRLVSRFFCTQNSPISEMTKEQREFETNKIIYERLKMAREQYQLDKKSYRIDAGYIIQRMPIFLTAEDHDMKKRWIYPEFYKKYDL